MTVGFNQSVYIIPEVNDFVDLCVNLVGELGRNVFAEVLLVETSASGKDDL